MLGRNIDFEKNDCSCNCSIFPQTKLAFTISRPPLERSRQPAFVFDRLQQKNKYRKEDKISLSQVKKERQRSKGLGPKSKEQLTQNTIPASNLKYNLQFDSYYAYQQVPTHLYTQQVASSNYEKPEIKRKVQTVIDTNGNHYLEIRKNPAQIYTHQYSHIQIKNRKEHQQSRNRIQIRPLPTKYESTIQSLKISPSIRNLMNDVSQPNTATSTKDQILSTQGSNYDLPYKSQSQSQIQKRSRQRQLTPEPSILSRKSSQNQQPGMYFRAIESINCVSDTDSISEVLSQKGFRQDPFLNHQALRTKQLSEIQRFRINWNRNNSIQSQKKIRANTSLNASISSLK